MKNVHAQLQHTKTVTRMLLGNLHLTQELLRVNQQNTHLLKNALKNGSNKLTSLNTPFLSLQDTPTTYFAVPRQFGKNITFVDFLKQQTESFQDEVLGAHRARLFRQGIYSAPDLKQFIYKAVSLKKEEVLPNPPLVPSSSNDNPCNEQPLPGLDTRTRNMLKGKKLMKFHIGEKRQVNMWNKSETKIIPVFLTGLQRGVYELIWNQSPRKIHFQTIIRRLQTHMKKYYDALELEQVEQTTIQYEKSVRGALQKVVQKKLITKTGKGTTEFYTIPFINKG